MGACFNAVQCLPLLANQPNLMLKTRPEQLLSYLAMALSITTFSIMTLSLYGTHHKLHSSILLGFFMLCHILFVVMPCVVMLNIVMLNVIMLSVVAPMNL